MRHWQACFRSKSEEQRADAGPKATDSPPYRLSTQRTQPKPAENTKPTNTASIMNLRFFLTTLGSG
ncbi:MAG TPA: hypothetical protein PKI20_18125 [Verrucomicrobiota bacterium]|nr:hypothetical protein [Verrucomicrobiota bacterium]HQL79640.1 hypothetical protein [Verrucomicrobiota bacterium]